MNTRLLAFVPLFAFLVASTTPMSAFAADCAPIKKDDTRAVQQRLKDHGYFAPAPTGYFGPITKAAVIAFQKKQNIDPIGTVGPKTRAALDALCIQATSGAVQGTSTAMTGLTVGTTVQPAQKIAAQEAMYVPFTSFTLTTHDTDVEVKSITVRRVGPSQNGAFDFISLFDEDNSELAYGYLKSDNTVIFKTPFTVPAGTTMKLTVVGSMQWDVMEYAAQAAGFSIESIDSSVPLSGAPLPIIGTFQVILPNLTIGRGYTSVGVEDPRGDRTQYIQDVNVRFGAVRVTAGSAENLTLRSVTWRQNGTAGSADIANVTVYVNGTPYATTNDGRDYTAVIEPWVSIPKGDAVEIQLRGDITTTGANRTIKFDIDDGAYIELWGSQFGYGIFPIPESNTDVSGSSVFLTQDGTTDTDSITPYYSGSTITISGGAITNIGK
ncbi:MAG: hypothetical protein RLZZ283_224 [Candidatus Parcubacteria bacterium]